MIDQALQWANDLGGIKNSITKGRGNIAGRLGELALAKHLGVKLEDNKNYDLIYNGKTVEIKTKRRTVPPQHWYEVSVAKTSTHQTPDVYAFVSIEFFRKDDNNNYFQPRYIWLCGYCDYENYFLNATKMKKGEKDNSNGFVTLVDMYNLEIGKLEKSI